MIETGFASPIADDEPARMLRALNVRTSMTLAMGFVATDDQARNAHAREMAAGLGS